MKRKIITLITILFVLSHFSSVLALTTIHETSTIERLSSGAVLKTYDRLTDKGWLSVNIVEVDLEDNYTNVGLLNSENGLNTFQTVYQMANKDNVIAAINGDFFNGNYKNGNTIGLSISDGRLLTSAYYENATKDTFGSFVLTEDNEAWFDYFTDKIILKTKRDNVELEIGEYNKIAANYSSPVIYTRDWGEKSIGTIPDLIMTEMLIINNEVKEIRYNEEAFDIPENGYVVSCAGDTASYVRDNFKVGTKVELEVDIDLDIEEIKMAVSGGAMLVENGKIPETFTSNISGSNPRTAIGLSKDEKTLYLITVDGRQNASIGVTQTELAELLIEKGIYNALNLDGGGSTTMVTRSLGEDFIKTINSPSGGVLRMVTNAVGIFNTKKTSSLNTIILKVPEENVFVNCSRKIEVLGYDKYYNPVEVNIDDISWSSSGVNVDIEDGIIYAGKEAGTAKITAKIGKVTSDITIDVLSAPNELEISPKRSAIALNEQVSFSITAKNKNGYYASIENDELDWDILKGDGYFKDGVYYPEEEGDHIISASAGDAIVYALITVGESNEDIIEDFENENFKFVSYPTAVRGDVEITREESYTGKRSAKITYDFTRTDATRAAYLRFDEPITIPEDIEAIKLSIYSEEASEDYIKLKIVDAKGVAQLVMLSKTIPGDEWKEVSYNLTSIALPATLTDIYVGQDNPDIQNEGEIYIDKLMFVKDNDIAISKVALPQDVKGEDSANKETSLTKENSLKIALYDSKVTPKTLLDKLTRSTVVSAMEKDADEIIYINDYFTGYERATYENSTFITLDVSNGGIRNTDYTQWSSLKRDIKNSTTKNIIIKMNGNLDSFTDEKERQLFVDVLCELKRDTSKNILVMARGNKTTYTMERGIRYLTVSNDWIDKLSPIDVAQNTKYILVTVAENEISYEIKNVFGK